MNYENELDPRGDFFWLPNFFADQLITRTNWYRKLKTKIAKQHLKKLMSDQAIEKIRKELSKGEYCGNSK